MKELVMSWHGLTDLGWLIFLLVLWGYFWRCRQLTRQTKRWKKTMGHITSCRWERIGHTVWPKISYVYQVGDIDFTGEYLFLDTAHNNPHSRYARNVAYQVANAYLKKEEIAVYYNPTKPEQAVLDRTIPRKLNLILSIITLLIILHLVFMFL